MVSSSTRDSDTDSTVTSTGAEQYRALCKDMVKKQVFLGQFTEKKFVPSLKAYRDLITVDASESTLFGRLLGFVSTRLLHTIDNRSTWIGISMAEASQCWTILTQLPDGLAFGEYLFKVKTISFKPNEISLKLKIVYDRDGNEKPITPQPPADLQLEDVMIFIRQLSADVTSRVQTLWADRQHITVLGTFIFLKNIVKYTAVTVLILGAFLFQAIGAIGRFSMTFGDESRKFIRVLMPLLLGLVDLANKMVGGFYILIAMIWRDTMNGLAAGRRPPPTGRMMVDSVPYQQRR